MIGILFYFVEIYNGNLLCDNVYHFCCVPTFTNWSTQASHPEPI